MGIGASVFLLAVGAILAFAVHMTVNGLDINVIGFVLMAAGLLGLFMTTMIFGRRGASTGIGGSTVVRDSVVTQEPVVRTERTVL